jgi:hypothetical protein
MDLRRTYYEKRKPTRRNNPQALNDDLVRQLWDRTEQLLRQAGRPSRGPSTVDHTGGHPNADVDPSLHDTVLGW